MARSRDGVRSSGVSIVNGRDSPDKSLFRETTSGEESAVIDSVLTVDILKVLGEEVSQACGGEVVVRIQRDYTRGAFNARRNRRSSST